MSKLEEMPLKNILSNCVLKNNNKQNICFFSLKELSQTWLIWLNYFLYYHKCWSEKWLFWGLALRHVYVVFVETSHGSRALGSCNMSRLCSEHSDSAPHWTGSWINMTVCMTSHMIRCRGLGRFMLHILLLNKLWAPRKTSADNLDQPSLQPRCASRTASTWG